MNAKTNDWEFRLTCSACPEQYHVFRDGVQVGYLRLRHGYFYVAYPTVTGEIIYDAHPKGDGRFESDERQMYLDNAKRAIASRLTQTGG